MSIELPQRHGEHEAGRMAVQGRHTDDGSDHTLIVVHENGALGLIVSAWDASETQDVR